MRKNSQKQRNLQQQFRRDVRQLTLTLVEVPRGQVIRRTRYLVAVNGYIARGRFLYSY